MTGFGKTTIETPNRKIVVEMKSLNSKQLDVFTKLPNLYKEKDLEIRNMIKDKLGRGKIDLTVYFDCSETEKEVMINNKIVEQYYHQILSICDNLGITANANECLQTVMTFPETFKTKVEELDNDEWLLLKQGVEEAAEAVNNFREQEGEILIADVITRVEMIENFSAGIPEFEVDRINVVKKKLEEKLKEWTDIQNIDENRLEQELVYYLEKLDITEEKVRLSNHCKYFKETVIKEEAPGRKLGFIAQEMGREINTIGSKANDCEIQKLVVNMKDELEKIKEQCLNIL